MDRALARVQGDWGYRQAGTAAAPVERSETGGLAAVDRIPTSPARIRARDDRGFTLIESLTAATILLVVSIGIITVLVTTGGWYAKAKVRTQASTVASQVMAIILSRNYSDLHFAEANEEWPTGIPVEMEWPTTLGDYTVETSMTPTTDPATGLDMKKVIVTAYPVDRPIDPPVTIIRYASGWQSLSSATGQFKVPVHVQCSVAAAGVRVQLLDVTTLAEARYAVTDSTGLAIFKDVYEVPQGYFLTADPRFGTDVRPVHFPTRIFPTHGGSTNNPILSVNTYNLQVRVSSTPAILRVGAYRGAGWRFFREFNGTNEWVSTEIPYRPIDGLTIYAQPTLNTSVDNGMYGAGDLTRYPDNTKMIYKATVNAYGVACIQVPWTIEPGEGQYWTIWCSTRDDDGILDRHERIDYATGSWTNDLKMPDLPSTGVYTDAPQWEHLGSTAQPVDDPTPPIQ